MQAPLFNMKPGCNIEFGESECPDGSLTERLSIDQNCVFIQSARITIAYGNAIQRKSDAIVNLANNLMNHGAGLAKTILDATGGDEGEYN